MIETIIGVVLGFILAIAGEWVTTARRDVKERKAVRALVELELKQNLSRLEEFWSEVVSQNDNWFSKDNEFKWGTLASVIGKTRLFTPSSKCWDSLVPKISEAFGAEEVRKHWGTYQSLAEIGAMHAHLIELGHERTDSQRHFEGANPQFRVAGSMISGLRFGMEAEPVAKKLCDKVEAAIGSETVCFRNAT